MNDRKIFKYSEESMQRALVAVKNGMPVATASRTYDVPRTTLYYKTIGKYPEKRKMGPSTYLTFNEESALVTWVLHMSKSGFPIIKDQLLDSVQLILKKLERQTPFIDNRPGRHWYEAFLRRHPEVCLRMTQNLTSNRAKVTEQNIRLWFSEIESYLKENKYEHIIADPYRVFNTDETAFYLNPKGGKVLARKGEKAVYSRTGDEKECLTTLITGNAGGNLAPPMIVFSYERIPSYISSSIPKKWGIGKSENGWMTGETFFMFITNIFHPWLKEMQIRLPIILFVDGHSSHLTLPLSEFCHDNGIILISLYPNATHILQPMDVAVFHALKNCWKKDVIKWRLLHDQEKLKKEHFAPLLEEVLKKTITINILSNGFRTCGLCPLNSDAIDYNKYIKEIRENHEDILDQPNLEVVPDNGANSRAQIFTEQLNKEIGHEKLEKFYASGNIWNGCVEDTSLFYLWRRYNRNNNLEHIEDVIDNTILINEGDYILEADWLMPILENQPEVNSKSDKITILQNIVLPLPTDPEPETENKITELQKEETIEEESMEDSEKLLTEKKYGVINKTNNEEIDAEDEKEVEDVIERIITSVLEKENASGQLIEEKNTANAIEESQKAPHVSVPKDIPSPFKTLLYWPQPPKSDKRTKVKVRLPSVASSEQWQSFHRKALEEKQKAEKEKLERKRRREEKANEKENIEKNRKKHKKGNKRTKSDVTNSKEEINETTKNTECVTKSNYVIVNYEGEHYPGKILNENTEEVFVTVMERSGINGWKWPGRPDTLWYKKEDVIMTISQPKKFNNRGIYTVPEMTDNQQIFLD